MSQTIERILNDQHENYILPFFWQHGEDEDTLRDYMRAIDEANIGAVCVESRPHPDFCGDKWWQDMDVILDEARKRNMKVWILDDSHFPTGFANGAMKDQPLSLARRSICCQKYVLKAGEVLSLDADQVKHPDEKKPGDVEKQIAMMFGGKDESKPQSAFADDRLLGISVHFSDGRAEDLTGLVAEDGTFTYPPQEDGVLYKMNTTRNRGPHPDYINMTDGASCRVLIDAVYEKHWEHYADDFGKTIAGFFSDEPELGNGHLYELHHEMGIGFDMDYPWGQELEAALKAQLGADFARKLPLIWETEGDESQRAKARYTYMDILTRLVEKNFSYQIGDWCRDHGVQYIGHIIEDNGQHCRTGSTLGHYFRSLFGQDMAGIDDIGGQVYPQGEDDNYDLGVFQVRNGEFYHFMLGKLASSLAALDEKKHGNAMCEIFGNYGWQEGLRLEKYLADHFMVRGVNHYVPHAFSAAQFPDPDCPPHFYAHGHNPEYKTFGQLMVYMNRANELISGGRHVAPVALLYHGEGEWTGKVLPDEKVARALAENQVEFDFVPFDAFSDKETYHTKIETGSLQINTQKYQAVLVPYMQFMDAAFVSDVKKLTDAGLPVYFVDGKPEGVFDGEISEQVLEENLADAEIIGLADIAEKTKEVADITIAPQDSYIRYYHYIKEDGMQIYMLVNEGKEVYEGSLDLVQEKEKTISVYVYDAWEQKIYASDDKDGKISLRLAPGKSRFLLLAQDAGTDQMLAGAVTEETAIADEAKELAPLHTWKRSTVKSIDYPAFSDAEEVSFPDDYAKVDPEFSGWIRYENTLRAEAGKRYWLEITDAFETVDVYVNDKHLGLQIFAPYVFDLSDALAAGENKIRIEVATTLERQMSSTPDPYGRPKEVPKDGSGITGQVHIYSL